ncbi:polysaccharide export protein [Pontiellaceae bacterium B12227]|nr:polysaccharide export protein [Pontiellaceae bacterium B12227]
MICSKMVYKHSLKALGAGAVFAVLLCSCSTLPGSGPSKRQMAKDQDEPADEREYSVVKMDVEVVQHLGDLRPVLLNETFSTTINGKPESVLGIGDQLVINIWETSGDGLFSTFEKKQSRIDSIIDESGSIFIPYVGKVDVAGKSIETVRAAIEDGLKGKAVEPQVQVALKTNVSNNLVVVGDVNQPGRYPLPIGGVRLLDAIARAGGSRAPIYEAEAKIVRGETSDTIRLDEILGRKNNNVWMMPGDTVQLMHKPRSFTAFGAVTTKSRHLFKTETLTMAEALAQSGGLSDGLADAGGVFLFRFEDPEVLSEAGVEVPDTLFYGRAATIYRLDFNEPEAFFLARSFAMQDKDIIYVANAFAAEYYKFIRIYVQPLLDISRTSTVFIN